MIKSNIQGLFTTPIYFSVLERNLTEKENSFIDQNKMETLSNNVGGDNETSKDNYILEKKELTRFTIKSKRLFQQNWRSCSKNKTIHYTIVAKY